MTEQRNEIIVSSDPANGAKNLSPDGSRFTVSLDGEGISIPKSAKWCNISMDEAFVWWSIQNIKLGVNDKVYSNYGVYTIPPGIYDLESLQSTLRRLNPTVFEWISLLPDYATGKVVLQLKTAGDTIDFTQPDTPRDILGFNAQIIVAAINNHTQFAENVAGFSDVTSLLIHSDLSRDGIPINNLASSIIGIVPINVKIGSLINSAPRNPARAAADNLIGGSRTSFKVWITDQRDRPVNTNGEYWSARFVLRFYSA